MQFKGQTSKKDTCTDSLLHPSIDETSISQTTPAASYVVNVDRDGTLPEKSQLTDVPLNLDQLAMIHNGQIYPRPKGNSSLQAVWTTEISKEYPGTPRIHSQNKRGVGVLRLLRLFIIALGIYYCFSAIFCLVVNQRMAKSLIFIRDEALQLCHNPIEVVDNIPTEYEGKLIHVTGLISVAAPLSFDECGISARSVKLARVHDLYRAVRAINQPNASLPDPASLDRPLDTEKYCEIQGYWSESMINEKKTADVAKIGPLVLGDKIKEKLSGYGFITEKMWIVNSYKVYRVTYIDTGRNGDKYSIIGKLVNGTIQPHEVLDFAIIVNNAAEDMTESKISEYWWENVKALDEKNWYSYLKIGTMFPLTAILFFIGFLEATKKTKRNHVMLSMPVQ